MGHGGIYHRKGPFRYVFVRFDRVPRIAKRAVFAVFSRVLGVLEKGPNSLRNRSNWKSWPIAGAPFSGRGCGFGSLTSMLATPARVAGRTGARMRRSPQRIQSDHGFAPIGIRGESPFLQVAQQQVFDTPAGWSHSGLETGVRVWYCMGVYFQTDGSLKNRAAVVLKPRSTGASPAGMWHGGKSGASWRVVVAKPRSTGASPAGMWHGGMGRLGAVVLSGGVIFVSPRRRRT